MSFFFLSFLFLALVCLFCFVFFTFSWFRNRECFSESNMGQQEASQPTRRYATSLYHLKGVLGGFGGCGDIAGRGQSWCDTKKSS